VFKCFSAFILCTFSFTQKHCLYFKNESSGFLLHLKVHVDDITGALGYLDLILRRFIILFLYH